MSDTWIKKTGPIETWARRAAAAVLFLSVVVLWWRADNVPALIADHDEVLLGYYSVNGFNARFITSFVLIFLALFILFPIHWTRTNTFKILSLTLSIVLGIAAVEVMGRLVQKPRYQNLNFTIGREAVADDPEDEVEAVVLNTARTRPPNQRYEVHYRDRPRAHKSYPHAPPGFPTEPIVLTTDKRGFRNQTDLETYDVVAVGDSFTEGSKVDDSECWPAVLAARTGLTVYNLGMSGSSPRAYLDAYSTLHDDLKPKTVIFMFYEGNDFRENPKEDAAVEAFNRGLNEQIKRSPIIRAFKRHSARLLSQVNTDAPVAGWEKYAWVPVKLDTPQGEQYYAFKPKRLTFLYSSREKFENSRKWRDTAALIERFARTARQQDVRFVFVYTPSMPHVLMPLVRDAVTPRQLHDFAALRAGRLPAPAKFHETFFAWLDVQEHVVRDFCAERGIEFVSLTAPLREAMAAGQQVYYTYDQHWTRLGQQVAAEVIQEHLEQSAGE